MSSSRSELTARLSHLRQRVTSAVSGSPTGHDRSDHPLRGLYLSHEQAVSLLDHGDSSAREAVGPPLPLGPALAALADRGGLDVIDIDILVAALAPDIDPRYEKLYGFIHDDLTVRRATIGLTMQLCGLPPSSSHRRRFEPAAPLVTNALLVVDNADRPFLGRTLRVPDHVTAFLLETTDVEALLRRYVVEPVDVVTDDVSAVREAIERSQVIHLTEGIGGAAAHVAATAAWAAGSPPFIIDVAGAHPDQVDGVIEAAIRHRTLSGDALIIRPVEVIAQHARRRLDQLVSSRGSTVLIGTTPWDQSWTAEVPPHRAIGELSQGEMSEIWQRSLGGVMVEEDAVELAQRSFRLTPEQIAKAARSATIGVGDAKGRVGFAELSAAARLHSASGLDRLARRLEPSARWEDLILPDDVMVLLRELSVRVRWRDQVMHQWGLGRGWRGQGIAALFAGPSGTGKTTAAEVVAGELGYDIHIVDLSVVVDKYIGETEKKLEVIFTEAERTNTVLLFDEADSIFGKRSEVKDARDRYANIEVSYLLQRIERFSGLAILTTNLGANLDEAFTRRLDLVIDFPRPDAAARERLWRHEFRPDVPTDGIDFEFCAGAFDLTGGNIRNVVITAAYIAAEARTPVSMANVVVAVQREYRKMGRLCVASEFGKYGSLMK